MRTVDHREEDLFLAAVELNAPRERATFLERQCGGDVGLRRRVEELLKLHASEDFILDEIIDAPLDESAADSASNEDREGGVIGNYELIRQLGEGGMGVVYLAQQLQPVQRNVAVKIIKAGMDTREVIARFEVERQALAMMDHPCITKVFDAGATAAGRPYFVMEMVSGQSITRYCDENQLSLPERFELFIQVCHAVQHAHQKGVIHRDIKPTNVLITVRDGQPVPKIIDFGIAKATHQRLTEATPHTDYAAIMGTPEYMSPEQSNMGGTDIDTRSDIYSLGVLLYELLAGETPFDGKQLRRKNYHQIREILQTRIPELPSVRLAKCDDEAIRRLCANRRTDARALCRMVRGDLDWITMKCLSKDRARRYETAADLAREVRRYLTGEPVEAAAPTWIYKFSKFAYKQRAALSVVSAIGLVLILGAVVSTTLAVRANSAAARAKSAESLATNRLDEANRAWQGAEFARQRAREAEKKLGTTERAQRNRLAISRAIARFNAQALQFAHNKPPGSAGQGFEISRWMRQELGDLQEVVVDSEPESDGPGIERAQRERLSSVRRQRSDIVLSQLILEEQRKALGSNDPLVTDTLDSLGELCLNAARFAEAADYLQSSLLVRAGAQPDSPQRFHAMVLLGKALARQDQVVEARHYLETARDQLAEHPDLDRLVKIAEAELAALNRR